MRLTILLLIFVSSVFAETLPYEGMDIYNPTREDYERIQNYLSNGERPYLKWIKTAFWTVESMTKFRETHSRNFCIIHPEDDPIYEVIHCGDPGEEKDMCIITYASYNKYFLENYVKYQERMIKSIKKTSFSGDIIQRLGGFPDITGGSLRLAHIPYAFKPAMFREARSLGYKRVFWLDCSYVALKDLDPIFDFIKERGYFAGYSPFTSSYPASQACNEKITNYFSINQKDIDQIPHYWSGAVGLDFTSEAGNKILDAWYKAAEDLDAFINPLVDQNAFAFVLYSLGYSVKDMPIDKYLNEKPHLPKPNHLVTGSRHGLKACPPEFFDEEELARFRLLE